MAAGYQTANQPPQGGTVNFGWISESWQLYSQNAMTWIVSMLIYIVVVASVEFGLQAAFGITAAITSSVTSAGASPGNPLSMYGQLFAMPMYWVLILVVSAIGAFFISGFMRMANATVRGEPISIPMIFQGGPYVLPVFVVQFALGIVGTIGALLFVLPAFVVYGALGPALALAADGESIGDSITKTLNATKSSAIMLGVFAFVMTLIYFVSVIPCGIGIFVTLPMILICASLIYRDIIGMPGAGVAQSYSGYAPQQPGVWPPPPNAGVGQPNNPYSPGQPIPNQPNPNQASTPYMPYAQPSQPQTPPQPASPYSGYTPPPTQPGAQYGGFTPPPTQPPVSNPYAVPVEPPPSDEQEPPSV